MDSLILNHSSASVFGFSAAGMKRDNSDSQCLQCVAVSCVERWSQDKYEGSQDNHIRENKEKEIHLVQFLFLLYSFIFMGSQGKKVGNHWIIGLILTFTAEDSGYIAVSLGLRETYSCVTSK